MTDVLKRVLTRGVIFAMIGIAIDVAGAFGLARYLTTLFFGVQPIDVKTFLVVAAILIVVALFGVRNTGAKGGGGRSVVALRYEYYLRRIHLE